MTASAHPLALSVAWLLAVFSSTGTPLWALWRPLAVVTILVVTLQSLMTAAFRQPRRAAWLTSGVAMSVAAVWLIALPLLATVAWLSFANVLRARRGRDPMPVALLDRLSMNLGFASLVFVALAAGQAVTSGAFWIAAHDRPADLRSVSGPDIYLVLLDGYPRADVLSSRFDIDNSQFTNELEQRGFDVAVNTRSNYSITWLTVASLFEMDYVQDLPELRGVSPVGAAQYRILGQLLNSSTVLRELRESGYRIVSVPSAYSDIALTNADFVYETVGPTWFEEQLLEKSIVAGAAEGIVRAWLAEQQRLSIDTSLDRLGEVATRGDAQPVFMFDHVFSPHPPFVHNADGTPRELQRCFPRTCSLREPKLESLGESIADYASGLNEQLQYLNGEVLASIDRLLSVRPDAVVILFSDHATRYDKIGDPGEAISNFFAARTPAAEALFGESPSPVNVLPRLLNRYLGTDHEIRRFRSWISYLAPLDLKPLDP